MIGRFKSFLIVFIPLAFLLPISCFAIEINRSAGVPILNDIVLSPAKVELKLDAGTQSVKYLNIINRIGQDAVFTVDVQDFAPSVDPHAGIILNKTVDGVDSALKKYITVDTNGFTLSHGESARIQVTIDLPREVKAGGRYAAVLISGAPLKSAPGATKVITQLGTLFFVDVRGSVNRSGFLKDASYDNGKIELVFENDGDIYLDPYAIIKVYQPSGELAGTISVDPWFVLPGSTRARSVVVSDFPPGKYTANISVNRGYDDIVDSRELGFEISGSPARSLWFVFVYIGIFLVILFLCKRLLFH